MITIRHKDRKFNTEIRNYKSSTPCKDCGKTFPYYVMDFDHVKGTKITTVNQILKTQSIAAGKKEIEKCELVCSNCHRIRTHTRKMQK